MRKLSAVSFAVVMLFSAIPLAAEVKLSPAKKALITKIAQKLATWGRDPSFVNAVRAQNAVTTTMVELRRIDLAWKAGKEEQRAKRLLSGPCAARLRQLTKEGSFNESFVMDRRGATVCLTNRTTSYWRGELPKFQKAFDSGRGAVFISEAAWDESAKANLVQISVPIMDSGKAIGVLTVGVNADALGK